MEKHPKFEGEKFLSEKYSDLAGSKSTERAVKKKIQEGGKGAQTKEERIEAYLDRLEHLALDPEKEQERKMFGDEPRPRALSLLREMVMNKYVRSNKEKMAEGAARVEERAARELGINARYGEQELEQRGEIAVEDLEKSLDNWISYLSDANEPYPVWFRYYAFRNILNLGDYDKDKGEFAKRSQGSARLFPDIDRGALAYVEQMIEASKDESMLSRLQEAQRAAANQDVPADQIITKEKAVAFAKLPFAKQYSEGIKQAGEITPEMRKETKGKWVKYQQGTDPTALWASLQNKGAAWCTKGFATAETQLKGGDFYVYYTLDKQGNPTIPRIAIRMDGHDKISQDVRGVLDSQQNVEGNMMPILDAKLQEFGSEADKFKKKSSDMKLLTAIESKTKQNQLLTKDDLIFLYEMDSKIEGFGYEKDPRIQELLKSRNPEEDMPILFECDKSQIAHNIKEITENTKAFVGELEEGIFKILPENVEHVYTEFPEGKIQFKNIELGSGPKTASEFEKAIKSEGHEVYDWAKDIMEKMKFENVKEKTQVELVILKVKSLGFNQNTTRKNMYERALKLGLELSPAEVGPELRLQYRKEDQPKGEYLLIGMDPISDSGGCLRVFRVDRDEDGESWLSASIGDPGTQWSPDYRWVFVRRKY